LKSEIRGYWGYQKERGGTYQINIYRLKVPPVPPVPPRILSPIEKLFCVVFYEEYSAQNSKTSLTSVSRGYWGYRGYSEPLVIGFPVPPSISLGVPGVLLEGVL